jgi:hypothetical protein
MKNSSFLLFLTNSCFMKVSIRPFLLLFLFIASLSCNPITRIAQGKEIISDEQDSISNLLVFPAYSNIGIVEQRDYGVDDKALADKAEHEIGALLSEFLPSDMEKKFILSDEITRENLAASGKRLVKSLKKSFNPKKAKVPEYLLQILEERDQDYGLFIMQIGFTRTYENMSKEVLRRRDLGMATLGIYNTYPYSSYSAMFGFLIDRKKKSVIRYKELRWPNKEPNDKYIIRAQVRDIILTSFQLGE